MPKTKEYKIVRISLRSYKALKKQADKEGKTFIKIVDQLTKK